VFFGLDTHLVTFPSPVICVLPLRHQTAFPYPHAAGENPETYGAFDRGPHNRPAAIPSSPDNDFETGTVTRGASL
jgi:hypothetical protein